MSVTIPDQASRSSMRSSSHSLAGGSNTQGCTLLDLPEEVLSQIACNLSLSDQISLLSSHSTLLSLTRSSYSPIPQTIRSILASSDTYPPLLARLPSLTLYVPDDSGRTFIDLLVRARPRWILEHLQFGRWTEAVWREAFERRFLRSWRRFKGEDDTWRAVFLRLLGRLEHRFVGCAHEESWTRFVTLHRNGSASINRIYSRTFDPYEIYDEFKHQNNFANQATHVRVVVHLQDVRILAIGVLQAEASLFINPNAHLVLHPPLLRNVETPQTTHFHTKIEEKDSKAPRRIPLAAISPSANSNEAYFPLVRSISPSGPAHTTYGMGEGLSVSPSSSGLLSTFARVLPGRSRRTSSVGSDSDERGGIFRVISRERDDDGRRRAWSFNRSRAQSSTAPIAELRPEEPRMTLPLTPSMPPLPELSPEITVKPLTPPRTPSPRVGRQDMPYPRVTKPQPHSSFRSYPNYTPQDSAAVNDNGEPFRGDRRMLHEEIEDEGVGSLWSPAESAWGGDGRKMSEWDNEQGCRRRWVGPMLLVAQLHPPDRASAIPPAASGSLEGDAPDLGHPGMYVSIGYEDLEDLFPWIKLQGTGIAGESRRSGLGFE